MLDNAFYWFFKRIQIFQRNRILGDLNGWINDSLTWISILLHKPCEKGKPKHFQLYLGPYNMLEDQNICIEHYCVAKSLESVKKSGSVLWVSRVIFAHWNSLYIVLQYFRASQTVTPPSLLWLEITNSSYFLVSSYKLNFFWSAQPQFHN